jgi:hypothetical protein
MTTNGTPAFIADATPGARIAYIHQSYDPATRSAVDTTVETTVKSVNRLTNGNTPKIQWEDAEGDIHNNRPDFHITILN